MNGSARFRLFVGLALVTTVATLGLAACARDGLGGRDPASGDLTELGWEAQALESMGFSPAQLAPPAAAPAAAAAEPVPVVSATAKPDRDGERARRWKRLRFGFRHTLHGEAVVQTEEGLKTVLAQRGAVTAINSTTMTVRSTDGFTLVWTFGDPLRVVENRNQVQPSAIAVGTELGVAGAKQGDAAVARLIVIPRAK